MSESTNSLREELIRNKDDKIYRHAYADETLNAAIATQIKVLREQRGWKQENLATEADMRQPMISRYENVNYSSWSIKTLKKLGEAFDVFLEVRFRGFRNLVDLAETFDRETFQVYPFTEDPYFRGPQPAATRMQSIVATNTAFGLHEKDTVGGQRISLPTQPGSATGAALGSGQLHTTNVDPFIRI